MAIINNMVNIYFSQSRIRVGNAFGKTDFFYKLDLFRTELKEMMFGNLLENVPMIVTYNLKEI